MALDSTERFSSRVDNYVQYRPSYPAEAIDLLRERCGLGRGSAVADLGSGTGILTALLLDAGARVFAVEPNPGMRGAAERLLGGRGGFVSVAGTAEASTLEAHSVGLVVAGQAFHWFDLGKTKKEFKRILKKGGYVAILYYSRSEKTELSKDYEKIVKKYGRNFARVRETDGRVFGRFFGKDKYKKYEFWAASVRRLDLDGFISRFLSASYMPKSSERSYKPMIRDIKRIFDKNEKNGVVSMSYDVVLYLGKL